MIHAFQTLLKQFFFSIYVIASILVSPSSADQKPTVNFTISVDWEGAILNKKDLDAMQHFRNRNPDIPLVHFLNAAYFTQDGARSEEIKKKIQSVLRPGDELGLHLHGWERLFTQAGVTFRSTPNFLKNRTYSFSSIIGEEGHDVAISAYTVDELRKVIRYSIDQLEANGFRGIRSFRAGGWLASPNVLEALAKEGILIDSSALPVSLVEQSLYDHPLHSMLSKIWPDTTSTSQPYSIPTRGGKIQEYPNNAGMADYVNSTQFMKVLEDNLNLARHNPSQPVFVHYGFHEESAALHLSAVNYAVQELKKLARRGEFHLNAITLTNSTITESFKNLEPEGFMSKCIRLFSGNQ